jgi:glyceraldehyde 3-phosphate dehydrogenase
MTTRIALHGFGRLARAISRIILTRPELGLELAVIAEHGAHPNHAHLLRHDSSYGAFELPVGLDEHGIVIDDRCIPIIDPIWQQRAADRWDELGIDLVIEATGKMRRPDQLERHLERGAPRVLLTAATIGSGVLPTLFVGPGFEPPSSPMVAAGSATGVALHPIVALLQQHWGLNALHGTILSPLADDQGLQDDIHHPCLWRARAGDSSLVPTTRGVGRSILEAFPGLRGRLMLQNLRTPIHEVGCLSLVAHTERPITTEQLWAAARDASNGPMAGVLGLCEESLVSCDFLGCTRSVTLDAMSIMASHDSAISFRAWYDATHGYASRIVDLARMLGEHQRT